MARRVVEKTQVTYVLEAVKESLKHLGTWGGGDLAGVAPPPREVAQQYSLLRRLREYLIRCVESFRAPAEWELSEDDENLLVSCIVHSLAGIDRRASDRNTNPKDRAWLVEKRDALIRLADEMQTKPVERIVHPQPYDMTTVSVLHFLERRFANEPLLPPVLGGEVTPQSHAAPKSTASGHHLIRDTPSRVQSDHPSGHSVSHDPDLAPGHSPPTDPWPAPAAQFHAHVPEEEITWEPLDLARVRDAMLRGLVGLDLVAFRRAQSVSDHRLQMIHLSSILEGIVLDAKIRIEGGIRIPARDVLEDLEEVLSRPLAPQEVACLAQLRAARNLLRPAIMRAKPVVVTTEGAEAARAFVELVLLELGYLGAVRER